MTIGPEIDGLDPQTRENVRQWLEGNYDEKTKEEIRKLLKEDPQKILDAFYTKLSFGTGGLRGIMGIGSNRMNIYTIRSATQGLANYIHKVAGHGIPSVIIGYDSRNHSKSFAEEAAKVLTGNEIRVYLFSKLSPLPLVSFGCRLKKCRAAIMITASHNPAEYNGYKVYWDYGGQVVPPHDQGIIDEVNQIKNLEQIHIAQADHPLITRLEDEIATAYLEAMSTLQLYPEENQSNGDQLKIIYTSLHGTGIALAPQTLAMWGFTNLSYVQDQVIPDGNFPTAHSPNPEERAALKLGIDLLIEKNGDLLLATDPDADRVGVVVNHRGKMVTLDGNEIACLCIEHICKALNEKQRLGENAGFIKSIVTTELFAQIANHYQTASFDVLTGFKYIAQLMEEWTQQKTHQFIFGAEESYGYLFGDYVRDKDAIISCALISEAALQGKLQGKTLIDQLHDIYRKYGVYRNHLLSVKYAESKEGHEQMKNALKKLRQNPPEKILGTPIICIEDYLVSTKIDLPSKKSHPLEFPKSDVLRFHLKDQSVIAVRPSGTEPKVKIYCEVVSQKTDNIELAIEHCDTLCKDYLMTVKALIQ